MNGSDLQSRLNALQGSFSPAEKRIITIIRLNPLGVAKMGVTELAKYAETSTATVVRTSKRLGFTGYPALRLALAAETSSPMPIEMPLAADIGDNDSPKQILQKLLEFEVKGATETTQLLSAATLEQAVSILSQARRIDIYGTGASALVAQDFCQKLRRIGVVAQTFGSTDESLVSACQLTNADAALAISHSGQTADVIEALTQAKGAGATTLAITANARAALARKADIVLRTSSREMGFRAAAMASRTSQLLIIDCLFIGVAQRLPGARDALRKTHDVVRQRRR
ncbi:MurR/RpiR family transcriptional regulator [Rahnella aceris]|jgi:DNA-binding MurR/RpiR family transcriptional regulator|uniref:MurR/RpiR family transcriptional regulator n=1 Tax=Rahnella sp. (strain Y9602) TaxID=2703885 RepID=UPI000256B711|nr:MurR/RpiR family transcriptional regulator [Rahnella aceris]AFE58667.1 RpiR family transcriptional regulator [Rahnella aquatilis HX2]MBU9859895.1 MurR/RpiR family transcriptional regulator [Rahnella aceris]QBJ07782.1 MurR/RpiR family transcriptional regulator [Rahnella aquatilis]